MSRYQKGKSNLDFNAARDSEWQWHQLGHMQVCISRQTDNHASTPPLSFYRPDSLPAAQPNYVKTLKAQLPSRTFPQTLNFKNSAFLTKVDNAIDTYDNRRVVVGRI